MRMATTEEEGLISQANSFAAGLCLYPVKESRQPHYRPAFQCSTWRLCREELPYLGGNAHCHPPP